MIFYGAWPWPPRRMRGPGIVTVRGLLSGIISLAGRARSRVVGSLRSPATFITVIRTIFCWPGPVGFTSLGYMLGRHAPGRMGLSNFLPAIHHAALAQAEGGRILRDKVPGAHIGTTFSCSEIVPYTNSTEDIQAAKRMDILMNRL